MQGLGAGSVVQERFTWWTAASLGCCYFYSIYERRDKDSFEVDTRKNIQRYMESPQTAGLYRDITVTVEKGVFLGMTTHVYLLAEPSWTLWLWPRPRSLPSFETSAAPICIPISIELETVQVCDNVSLQWRIQGWRVATEACDTPGARLSYRDSAFRIGLLGLLERYVQTFGVVHASDYV